MKYITKVINASSGVINNKLGIFIVTYIATIPNTINAINGKNFFTPITFIFFNK